MFQIEKKTGIERRILDPIPSLTMVRGDGTTLYTTRDIAYSIWKFQMVDKVINVIGADQILSQLQLKLALYALGYDRFAENLIHFAFNLVRFPSHRMSSRRGHYIALDEVIDEAVKRALKEVSIRSPHLSEKERQFISKAVGIGALKYALLEVDPTKQVVFTWDRVLNFEKNSAPYIQYSHARACSILRKADSDVLNPDYSLLKAPQERAIILMLARFSEVFIDTTDSIKPNVLVDFVTSLADKFNTFYALIPVLKAEPLELSHARLVLVDAVSIVLRNVLNLLGIEALEKM
jgi:arginyl-tRNA synthetase